jgi:hypothetical protein
LVTFWIRSQGLALVDTDIAPVTQCERAIKVMRPATVITTPTAAKAR